MHSVRVDSKNRILVLDSGGIPEAIARDKPKLYLFSSDGQVIREMHFPAATVPRTSLLNDMAIDAEREIVFISDTSPAPFGDNPAIVVVDWALQKSYRILQDHYSLVPIPPSLILWTEGLGSSSVAS